jgi:ABC-type multidrug transport system fused ATPase/permease subunit
MIILKKLLNLLNKQERKQATILVGIVMIGALFDVVGLASIMPFIGVIANPQLIESNPLLSKIYHGIGFDDQKKFLFFLGLSGFILLLISLTLKAFITYLKVRFTLLCEFSIGKRLIEGYLHQPYVWFLNRNSADLGKTILSEVGIVINNGLMPLMNLVAQGFVTVTILILLISINPVLALSAGVVLGLAYGTIFSLMSTSLRRLGQSRILANRERFTILNEAFGALKELKVGCLEQAYIYRFATPAKEYANSQANSLIIAQLPRFMLEAIAFGGMLLVMLYLSSFSGGFSVAIPIIVLYAFAGYRLMPALQIMYAAFTQLRFIGPAVDALNKDLMSLSLQTDTYQTLVKPMPLNKAICLKDIVCHYPNNSKPVLKHINLTIMAKSTVAFVGETGSGKTTIADVILGLIEPLEGQVIVDDKVISANNRRNWQRSIGYVPQQIYLADNSVSANIAFGVDSREINQHLIERAAKIANLHDFVINDLPQGYNTIIGERGIRLSGGQRQRIGIARALYHNPKVLVLDEATSALDNLTEQAVMEAVNKLGDKITIIMIAHRLSTVRNCDQIYVMEYGEIIANGTFEELIGNSYHFAKMITKV